MTINLFAFDPCRLHSTVEPRYTEAIVSPPFFQYLNLIVITNFNSKPRYSVYRSSRAGFLYIVLWCGTPKARNKVPNLRLLY